jgi:hypothetical protein
LIYNVANTLHAGRPVKTVVDALGVDMGQTTLECDTRTGRVERYAIFNGACMDDGKGSLIRETVYGKPPLLVTFADGSTSVEEGSWLDRPPLL